MTPADFPHETRDLNHEMALFDAYVAVVRRDRVSVGSQLGFVAYLLAEIEHAAPTRGLMLPALEQLMAENLALLDTLAVLKPAKGNA